MNGGEVASWRSSFKAVAGPFLFSRLWIAFFVYFGHAQHAYLAPIRGGWQGVGNWWLNPWTTFDSAHFLAIAQNGYDSHTAAFFPLYPWLLRLAGNDLMAMAAWGVLLSNIALFAALACLHHLTEFEHDARAARIAVCLTAFCPTAMYFSAVYSESLFLLWFVLTFWCVRQNRWLLAAGCAFLAALTRQVGILIFLALIIEWQQARKRGEGISRFAPFAAFAPLAAVGIWQICIALEMGDAARGLTSQQEYLRAPVWPWVPIARDAASVFQRGAHPVLWLHLAATVMALGLVFTSCKRQPISYTMMIAGVMAMNFSLARTETPCTLPIARYLMTMFPFTQRLAVLTAQSGFSRFIRLALAALYLAICAFFAFRFGLKDFIS